MKVIKLGGSLINDYDALTNCLNIIEQKINKKVVIVPGGGVFADQVRLIQQQWGFDEVTAHQMAILAMQQTALLLKSIKPQFELSDDLETIKNSHAVVIWSADMQLLNNAAIEASWDITSDSLAAWLANQLPVDELILVKSTQIPIKYTIQQMQQQGILDTAFHQFTQDSTYQITLLNKHGFNEHPFS